MEEICIGVDWEARQVRAAWSKCASDEPTTIEGCEPVLGQVLSFLHRVRRASRQSDGAVLHVIIEAGSMNWIRLFHAAGAVVHVIDPKQARRFAESMCSSMAKDDARDASVLLKLGQSRSHCPDPWTPASELVSHLDMLAKAHRRMLGSHTRCVQQVRQLLRESMPAIEELITDISAQWAREFIEKLPTAWHIAQMSPRRLTSFVSKLSCRGKTQQALKEAIAMTQAPWLDETMASLQALQIQSLLKHIALYRQELDDIAQRITQVVSADEDGQRLLSIGGIGPKLAAAIMRFHHTQTTNISERDTAAIRMGAAPVFIGSGTTRSGAPKGFVRMRKAAQADARRAVYLIGRLVAQNTPWAMAMYEDGKRRGQKPACIYRRIARCLLRIIHAVLRDKSTYDPQRYLLNLQKKGVPWAVALAQ